MTVTCPYGGGIKAGLQAYVYGYEVATQIAEQFLDYPIIGNIVDALDWVVFDLQRIADNGPLEYPIFEPLDFTNKILLVNKVRLYFEAWLWDHFCECLPLPDG